MKIIDGKYKAFKNIDIQRTWPDKQIQKAPIWCSVDLRDGNQALIKPMSIDEKTSFFKLLVDIGFKQIEIGFPSASQIEYDFLRKIIDENLIPDDVTIQVLCQARESLIKKTFQSIKGAKNVIFHIYNSTSIAQRKIVFQKSNQEIIDLILEGLDNIIKYQNEYDGNLTLEYSPESFTNTELQFAKEICDEVVNKYLPHTKNKIIINLPATIEVSTPNVYADMMEWMSENLDNREKIILSTHNHNDRGTAVGAAELSLLAGSDRIEGTILGNGERTGNVDILTLALNMYTQGINPHLDFSNVDYIISKVEEFTKIPTHIRHPYVGELVYTAFSGSHQDAIKKGMSYQKQRDDNFWEVPYLPIDPSDLNRTYQDIIRINAQSGKGGVAYIIEENLNFTLPKEMQVEFSKIVQQYSDSVGVEVHKDTILKLFNDTYINVDEKFHFISINTKECENNEIEVELEFNKNNQDVCVIGKGNGPVDAAKKAISDECDDFIINSYSSHSIGKSSSAKAVSYVEITRTQDNKSACGIGIDTNTTIATIKSIFCSLNRL